MDSGCGLSMSGVGERLVQVEEAKVTVRGFNGNCTRAELIGKNEDGKSELFVKEMPGDLVLLSARQYAEEGAIVLFADDGYVLRLRSESS
jgi:hypothetical protein